MLSKQVLLGIVFGVVVVVGLGLGIGLTVGKSDSSSDEPENIPEKTKNFTLSDYLQNTYQAKSIQPNFLLENQIPISQIPKDHTIQDLFFQKNPETSDIEIWNFKPIPSEFSSVFARYKNHTDHKLDDGYTFEQPFDYKISPDGKYIWYAYEKQDSWRGVAYNASYELYSIEKQDFVPSIFENNNNNPCPGGKKSIQFLTWGPIYVANSFGAFVCDYDIYFYSNPTDSRSIRRLTFDGQENKVYNGIPEWVYQEEILGTNNAIYFGRTGQQMMFVKFKVENDAQTQTYRYSIYGNAQYPKTVDLAYPKAGTNPPSNHVFIYDIINDRLSDEISIESDEPADFSYFYRTDFSMWNDDNLVIVWTNRNQNKSTAKFLNRDTKTGHWREVAAKGSSVSESSTGWIGHFGPFGPYFDGFENENYFTMRSRPYKYINDSFFTMARIDRDSDEVVYLSEHQSDYSDTNLWHWDVDFDVMYYYAAYPEARHRQMHMIPGAMTNQKSENPGSVTQKLLKKHPESCGNIDARAAAYCSSSPLHKDQWIVFNCLGGKGLPMSFRKKMNNMQDNSYESFELLEDNQELHQKLIEVAMPIKEYGKYFSSKYPNRPFNYQLFKPYDFSLEKRYKLVIEVYGAPEFQSVVDSYNPDFCQSLVSETGNIICASVDGRGSAFQGDQLMHSVYKNIGQFEAEDQSDFAEYLATNFDWIDKNNIAIWGWSYGGYVTTMSIAHNSGIFKCGVAVAPVTSWRYYDIVYSERYLQTPEDNPIGYENSEVWNYAKKQDNFEGFRKSWYTIIAGTADDNVHFQNAAQFSKKLIEQSIDFDSYFYADEDHSLSSSGETREHVYRNIRRHLLGKRCLDEQI